MPRRLGLKIDLASQIVLLATCIGAATAGAFAIIFHLHLSSVAATRYAGQMASENQMLIHSLRSQMSKITHDHAILTSSAHILEYIEALSNPALAATDRDRRLQHARFKLAAFLHASEINTRIQLIPDNRQFAPDAAITLVKDDEPAASPAWSARIMEMQERLAESADTQGVAMAVSSYAVDPSMMDSPRIASASSINDDNGHAVAMIVIEADYEQFLATALHGHGMSWGFAVIDSNGNYHVEIPGIDQPGMHSTENDNRPVTEDVRNLAATPQIWAPTESQIGGIDLLTYIGETTLGSEADSITLRIASVESREELGGELLSLAQLSLFLFTPVVLVSAALGAYFGRRVAQPLKTMNEALLRSRTTTEIPSLPVERQDELGEFARSFTSIIDRLRQRMRTLDQGNIDLQATNTALATANEDIRGLTHIISHDLRAPLVNLMGFSDELSREMGTLKEKLGHEDISKDPELRSLLDDHVPRILKFIGQSASKMEMKLDVVLKLSRMGRYEIGQDPINIQQYFETAVANHVGDDSAVEVSIELGHLPVLIGDRQAATVFAENLVGNAYNYRDPSRPLSITVTGHLDPSGLTLCVADTGRGISEADAPRVFKLFARAGGQNSEGQGVGLSYCKALAARVDGRIWFESEVGVGTRFYLFLPSNSIGVGSEAA